VDVDGDLVVQFRGVRRGGQVTAQALELDAPEAEQGGGGNLRLGVVGA
jgi:hypothetical protein